MSNFAVGCPGTSQQSQVWDIPAVPGLGHQQSQVWDIPAVPGLGHPSSPRSGTSQQSQVWDIPAVPGLGHPSSPKSGTSQQSQVWDIPAVPGLGGGASQGNMKRWHRMDKRDQVLVRCPKALWDNGTSQSPSGHSTAKLDSYVWWGSQISVANAEKSMAKRINFQRLITMCSTRPSRSAMDDQHVYD